MAFETSDNVRGTSGLFGAETVVYYTKDVLDFLRKAVTLDQFGQKKSLPKGSGKTISFQRYTAKAASDITALTEGTTPSGLTLASTEITAVPLQYGAFVEVSDALIMEKIDPVIENALKLLKDAAVQNKDVLTATALHSNLTNQFAGGAANVGATSAGMTAAEIRKGMTYLNAAGVPKFSNKYVLAVHPYCLHDLMSETVAGGWLETTKYTSNEEIMNGEIGTLYGVKIVSTPNIQSAAEGDNSAVVYRNFLLGREAYGQIDLAGEGSVKVIVKALGAGDDPLDQRSTVGVKYWHVTKVLEAARGREVFATATLI